MKLNKTRIFDILIGLLAGLIIAFVVMILTDKRAIHGGECRESVAAQNVSQSQDTNVLVSVVSNNEYTGVSSPTGMSYGQDGSEEKNDTDPPTEEYVEYTSITDYFEHCDPNWNDSVEYQDAVKAYESAMASEIANYGFSYEDAMIEYAYIDEDDIPELLLGYSNHTPDGIIIYKYIPEKEEVINIGEFSQFGGVGYVERGNRIISQYGNQGLYLKIISMIEEDKAVAVGSVAEDGTGRHREYLDDGEVWMINDGVYYYARYDLPEGADGSHKDIYSIVKGTGADAVEVDFPDDEYVVNEDEYNRIHWELLGNPSDEDAVRYVKYADRYSDPNGRVTTMSRIKGG